MSRAEQKTKGSRQHFIDFVALLWLSSLDYIAVALCLSTSRPVSVSHSISLTPSPLGGVQHPSLLSAAVKCDNLIVL